MSIDTNIILSSDDYTFISLRPVDYFYGNSTQLFEINAIVNKSDLDNITNPYIKIYYPLKMEIYFEKQKGNSKYNNVENDTILIEDTYSNVINKETAVVVYSKTIYDKVIYIPKQIFLVIDMLDEISNIEEIKQLMKKHIELYNSIYEEVINSNNVNDD